MPATTYNHHYLTHHQLAKRSNDHRQQRDTQRLACLTSQRNLLTLSRRLDDHKRLLLALSQQQAPRVHQLVAVCLRQGDSVPVIMDKLAIAVQGHFNPKVCRQVKMAISTDRAAPYLH
jgi:hypothetical protein